MNKRKRVKAQHRRRLRREDRDTASKLGWSDAQLRRYMRKLDEEHRMIDEAIARGIVRAWGS